MGGGRFFAENRAIFIFGDWKFAKSFLQNNNK